MDMAKKKEKENGKSQLEAEVLLIAAQNNVIMTNYTYAEIDNTQQNSKCWLCVKRDGTIDQVVSECIKLPQKKFKTKYDWVGKVIHWELCK